MDKNEKKGLLQFLKLETEKGFELIAKDSIQNNPLANDPLLGAMHRYQRIIETGQKFKKDFVILTKSGQLTEKEINELIDEVQHSLLKKYFENFD
jgi:hypothetical protein